MPVAILNNFVQWRASLIDARPLNLDVQLIIMNLTDIQHSLLNHLYELAEDTISALFNQVSDENPKVPQAAFASFMDRELGGLIKLGLLNVARKVREPGRYFFVEIDSDEPESEWPVSSWVEFNTFNQSWQSIGYEKGTFPVYVVLKDKGYKAFSMFNDWKRLK